MRIMHSRARYNNRHAPFLKRKLPATKNKERFSTLKMAARFSAWWKVKLFLTKVGKQTAVASSQGEVIAAIRDQSNKLRANASKTLEAINQLRAANNKSCSVPPRKKHKKLNQATFFGVIQTFFGKRKVDHHFPTSCDSRKGY